LDLDFKEKEVIEDKKIFSQKDLEDDQIFEMEIYKKIKNQPFFQHHY
jgi:hypothetical protein